MLSKRFWVIAGMILMAAASRLVPHPPNFTPIGAIALFGGASFASRRLAFLVPLGAMFLSDAVIGWHPQWPWVYASFALAVSLGFWLRHRRTAKRIAGATLASSLLFFLLTNFGVWIHGRLYPLTLDGLVACYLAAIPFFRNSLLGDALYAALLFGALALAEKRLAALREPAPVAAKSR